ncbi:MAG: molybdopterin molybdotransferase MoeA [Thermoleophilia bacterium]
MSLRNVTFDEAREEMLSRAPLPEAEPVPLEGLAGRRLARDLRARVDNPAFTNSAMDGFAVRSADAAEGLPLRIVGESRAGAPFGGILSAGEAVRISTGAVLPDGLDAILRVEDAEEAGGLVTARVPPPQGAFVRRRGEDVRRGDLLLPAGHRVAPHEVATIAAMGHGEALCDRRLRVGVLGSGDEVVTQDQVLAPGQVYDANRPGIAAQARAAGAVVLGTGIVRDDRAATVAAVRAALDFDPAPDLLITTGGVSVGPHDHLRPAFEAAGVEEVLFGVQIRPGHPLWLGVRGRQVVIGLPGNPVSAAVCFHAFARPLLSVDDDWSTTMPLAVAYTKPTPRTELIRCREEGGALAPMARQASHDVTSLAGASHLAVIPSEAERLEAGERVRCCRLA